MPLTTTTVGAAAAPPAVVVRGSTSANSGRQAHCLLFSEMIPMFELTMRDAVMQLSATHLKVTHGSLARHWDRMRCGGWGQRGARSAAQATRLAWLRDNADLWLTSIELPRNPTWRLPDACAQLLSPQDNQEGARSKLEQVLNTLTVANAEGSIVSSDEVNDLALAAEQNIHFMNQVQFVDLVSELSKAGLERTRLQKFATSFFNLAFSNVSDVCVLGDEWVVEEMKARKLLQDILAMFGGIPSFVCHLSTASAESLDVLETTNGKGVKKIVACLRASVASHENWRAKKLDSTKPIVRRELRVWGSAYFTGSGEVVSLQLAFEAIFAAFKHGATKIKTKDMRVIGDRKTMYLWGQGHPLFDNLHHEGGLPSYRAMPDDLTIMQLNGDQWEMMPDMLVMEVDSCLPVRFTFRFNGWNRMRFRPLPDYAVKDDPNNLELTEVMDQMLGDLREMCTDGEDRDGSAKKQRRQGSAGALSPRSFTVAQSLLPP